MHVLVAEHELMKTSDQDLQKCVLQRSPFKITVEFASEQCLGIYIIAFIKTF